MFVCETKTERWICMLTDLEIAQKAEIKPITEIAKELGVNDDD